MGPVKRKVPAHRSRTQWMDMISRPREPPKPDLEETTLATMADMEKILESWGTRPYFMLSQPGADFPPPFPFALYIFNLRHTQGAVRPSRDDEIQPPTNADDLISNIYFDLAYSDVDFPTERRRAQHQTVRKMMTATSARPDKGISMNGQHSPDSLSHSFIISFEACEGLPASDPFVPDVSLHAATPVPLPPIQNARH
ncbi:hypothetical protein CISG_05156 [Coccidioides immitis RMSCC 3703]|uniref:Uncharacterized protein n=2 Tax=Coccidioides immitis TaxID=5501 RepID=A0A0J8QSJ2_COCIT|nr:hypothetical protein CIRG_00162 [Coccidioides immitis RMSCC 2394]KMU75759.1 hypothetical protein CISG_05156 [Coccidioides immitis RMSCC 3703]